MVKLIKKIYNGILENLNYNKQVCFVESGSEEEFIIKVSKLIDQGWELNGKWSVERHAKNNTSLWRQPMFRKVLK